MIAFLIVIGRIVASPLSNLWQKRLTNVGASPAFIVFISYLSIAILIIPFVLSNDLWTLPNIFWGYMIAAALVDTLGNIFLVKSLKLTDLSIFGPLNAYKPAIAMVLATFALGEEPSFWGFMGVFVILFGSYLLYWEPHKTRESNFKQALKSKAFWYRILGITCSAVASVLIKPAILHSSPITTLAFWAILGTPAMGLILISTERKQIFDNISKLSQNRSSYLALIICLMSMQGLTQFTFEKFFVGYSLAFFQLSALISIGLGYFFFNEKNIRSRLLGAFVMIIGALLIIIGK